MSEDKHVQETVPIQQIVVNDNPLDAYRRDLRHLLDFLVTKVYNDKMGPTETINVLIQGDGRRTGRSRRHFLVTVALLNVGKSVLSPKHHFVVLLTAGGEGYDELDRVLPYLRAELDDLRANGLALGDGIARKVEVHLSADWKLLNCVMGLSGATAMIFCPWCLLTRDERTGACKRQEATTSRESVWTEITGDGTNELVSDEELMAYGHVHHPILPAISPARTWLDPLHLFLRITDTLIGLLMEDLEPAIARDKSLLEKITKVPGIAS